MKFTNIFLWFGAAVFLLLSACTDLEEEIYSDVTPDNFFNTDEEFIAALGAAYTSLYGFTGNVNLWGAQEVQSDEITVPTRGTDWDDGGAWRRAHLHSISSEDAMANAVWGFCFGGISTCNRLIFQFEEIQVEGSEAFIAELKGLRAVFYLWLLDTYGNVPIVTDFDVPDDFAPPNASRQEVYDFVESELLAVAPALTRDVDLSTYGRVNYYVAQMALAKLYLNAEVYSGTAQWSKAGAACDEIINSGKYMLTSNYFDNFKTDNTGSPEFIFAIPYDKVFAGGFNVAQMTLHYLSQATYNLAEQPWNGFCTLQEFFESYEDGDIRKGEGEFPGNFIYGPQFSAGGERLMDSGAEPQDPDGPPLTFTPNITALSSALRQEGARIGKYEIAQGATASLSNDFPIYRYADVILMKAEVLLRQGDQAMALALVNQIRERAGVEPWTELTEDMLLAERGREFFVEAHRRTDLIRFGKFNDPWWAKPATEPCKQLMPIPRSQLDANKNLTQNECY